MAESSPKAAAPKLSLTRQTARGFAWMMGQTVVTKSVELVAQLILGKLLLGEEWGLIGIAMAVRVFTDVLRRTGLRQVLIQRHLHFDRWASPGFWMALSVGTLAMVVMIALAPAVAAVYDDPELATLMIVLALVPPIGGLGTVPVAKLQADLRFRALAISDTTCRVGRDVLRVVLVMRGFGPLGYILPEPLSEAARTIAYWWLTRPRIRMAFQWRRWRFLLADTGWMFLATNANKLAEQADKLILGLFHAKDVVGAYFWAYMLSRQTIDVFVWNLEKILLPALSHLQLEPERQVQAFLRAARLLAVLVVPICLMLAAAVDPLLHVIYPGGDRHDSIPVIEILGVAMSMWVIYGPTASLIKAQGRFKLFMVITWIYAALLICVISLTAWLSDRAGSDGAVAVAVAVGACMTLFGPIQAYLGIRIGGGTWKNIAGVYLPPLITGVIAIGAARVLADIWPLVSSHHVARIGVIGVFGGGFYLLLLRLLLPRTFRSLIDQIRHIVPSTGTVQTLASDRDPEA